MEIEPGRQDDPPFFGCSVREIPAKWDIKEPKAEPLIGFSNAFVKVQGKANGIAVINLNKRTSPAPG